MSNSEAPTMSDICRALADVYTENGVAMWLASANSRLDGDTAIFRCSTPEGRREVYALAYSLRGMVAT